MILEKHGDKNFNTLYKYFYELIQSIKGKQRAKKIGKILSKEVQRSITYRMRNYTELYSYYINHNRRYIEDPLCTKLINRILHRHSKNHFDYYMIPEQREIYKLREIFIKKQEEKDTSMESKIKKLYRSNEN